MAEFFATTHDVYLLLGHAAEDERDCDTADGRPATCEFARARLARMIGGDQETIANDTIHRLAAAIAERQLRLLCRGIQTVGQLCPMPPRTAIVSGSGRFLAQKAIRQCFDFQLEIVEFPGNAEAACAVAVAHLIEERQ